MKVYLRVLQSARVNGKQIGPQYHMHDKHFRKWCEGKTEEEIREAIMTPKERKLREKEAKAQAKASEKAAKKKTKKISDKVQKVVDKELDEIKKILGVIESPVVNKTPAPKRAKATKGAKVHVDKQAAELRKKLVQEWRQKTSDEWQSGSTDHIKSVGNGL